MPDAAALAAPPSLLPEDLLRTRLREVLRGRSRDGVVSLFVYGALMWQRATLPGATFRPARLDGFARTWSLRDIHHRGTPAAPGLTLALEPAPGMACDALLASVPADAAEDALWPAWRQEMAPGWYVPAWVEARPLPREGRDGERGGRQAGKAVRALAFLADAAHPLHARLTEREQAAVIARAGGPDGGAAEYLDRLMDSLRREGLEDAGCARLAAAVAAQRPPP